MSQLAEWRVRWKNFRGYDTSQQIELPALTLLIGRNNVGKTSAYAPLLLLRQTLDARNPETALLFRGDLVDFGSYEDIVTDHDTHRQIEMSLNFGPIDIPTGYHDATDIPIPQILELTFGASHNSTCDLIKSSVQAENGRIIVSRTHQADGSYKVLSPLLPRNREVGRPIKEVSQLRQNMTREAPSGFLFSGIGGLRLPRKWRDDKDRWQKVQDWYRGCSAIYDIYSEINYQVTSTLHGIAYLGPLRSPPQRTYRLSAEPTSDVGRDGQWAPEVLFRSSQGKDSFVLEQVNEWLVQLGYGRLSFTPLGDYFQAFVTKPDSNVAVNLSDCGAGLSQLLPLLVQGCVMKDGDTLIAQQPEIHLNPAQQDLITDFLVNLAMSGRRVIIETHSEHVLGRLRRRIAEGETIENNDVALYFSESVENRSTLRRISIGEWGEVRPAEWPSGFFGEQLENSLKMALAQARRKSETTI